MRTTNIIIIIIIIIILVLILFLKDKLIARRRVDNFSSRYFNKFKNMINSLEKKTNVFIFSSGPSLNELNNIINKIPNEIINDSYIIAVKGSINKLYELNIKCDFLVLNYIGNSSDINLDLKPKELASPKIIGVDFGGMEKLREKTDYMITLDGGNWMSDIVNNKISKINFYEKDNKIYTHWGHTMTEVALPLAMELQPKNIYILGWDYCRDYKYFSDPFIDWHSKDVIVDFTKYLPTFLKKNYDINIYKLSNTQCVNLEYKSFN